MITGFYHKFIGLVSKPYALLLLRAKTRRKNAESFHRALAKDLQQQNRQTSAVEQHLKSVGLRNVPETWLQEMQSIIKKRKRSSHFLDLLQQTNSKHFTAGEWLELSMYFLSLGLFKASITARSKSHKSFDDISHRIAYGLIYPNLKISSYFDRDKWEQCSKVYSRPLINEKGNPYYKRFFAGNSNAGKDLHQEYYNLIKGKRVAVIGPLVFDQDYRSEINDFDLVIELNALKSTRDKISSKYHGNPDIIYYNNSRVKTLAENDFNNIPDQVKYYVLKTDKYQSQLSSKASCRVIHQSKTLTWNGTFSMMECALSDVLLFAPSEVKVYGVDLYLSFNYDKSYGNEPPQHIKSITMNFTVHDIFTQFIFMRKLFDEGYIKADQRLSAVLKLDLQGYANRLSELYPVYINHEE